MAMELLGLGVELFVKRWVISKNAVKAIVDEYLKNAAIDKKISHTDIMVLRKDILEMISITSKLDKSVQKSKKNINEITDNLVEICQNYIFTLKKINNILDYKYLNEIFEIQGKSKFIRKENEIKISQCEEEIALLCIFIANKILSWIFVDIFDFELNKENLDAAKEGIKFLLTAKKVLHHKKDVNEKIREYINQYILAFKAIAQYFLSKIKLQQMVGINITIETVANELTFVIRQIDKIDENKADFGKEKMNPLHAIQVHSKAILGEIQGCKYIVGSLKNYKLLGLLAEGLNYHWEYSEWKTFSRWLEINWDVKNLTEDLIDYSIGESKNIFTGTKQEFDEQIDNLKPFAF